MATTRPYKTVKGQRVTVSPREVKAYVMRVNNWTEAEYNQERYKLKNRLRTYEAYAGIPSTKAQSPTTLLYFEAKRKAQAGAGYTPSAEMQRIKGFSGYGSASAIQKALASQKARSAMDEQYTKATLSRFGGLIEASPKAKEIAEKVTDPVKREQALRDYANALGIARTEARKQLESEAIPIGYGEMFGYAEVDDFDYSAYI